MEGVIIRLRKWRSVPKPWSIEQKKQFMEDIVECSDFVDRYFEWHDKKTSKSTAEEIKLWIIKEEEITKNRPDIIDQKWRQGYLTALGNIKIFLEKRFGIEGVSKNLGSCDGSEKDENGSRQTTTSSLRDEPNNHRLSEKPMTKSEVALRLAKIIEKRGKK